MRRVILIKRPFFYEGEIRDIFSFFLSQDKNCQLEKFEQRFLKYIGGKSAFCTISGRMALYLILKALNLKEKDEVILPVYTFFAIPTIISSLGLKPVFVDIDETCNINPELIPEKITSRSKVIIPTHLFGQPCNMEKISKIAKKFNLFVIEDCAHALGAEYKGRKVGSLGDASFFSFSVSKFINTFKGGAVIVNNSALLPKIKTEFSNFKYPPKSIVLKIIFKLLLTRLFFNPPIYSNFIFPINLYLRNMKYRNVMELYRKIISRKEAKKTHNLPKYRYTNLQASIANKQLLLLDRINDLRRQKLEFLCSKLKPEIKTTYLSNIEGIKSAPLVLGIYSNSKKETTKKLLERGIEVDDNFMQNCSKIFDRVGHYPVVEKVEKELLILNIDPYYKMCDLIRIAQALNEII